MSRTVYETAGDHTFTWPDGNCTALVRVVGGGAGGGASESVSDGDDFDLGAGGGGGGGSAWAVVTKSPTATTLDITVGAGGVAETFGGESTASQDATVLFSATGGAAPIGRNGGLPGTGVGGFVNTTGGNGGDNDQGIFVVPVSGGGGGGQGAGRVRNGNPGRMNGSIGGQPGFGPVGNGGAGGFGGAGPDPGPATDGADATGPGGGGGGGGAGKASGSGYDGWAEVICPAPPRMRKCCCPPHAISCDDTTFYECTSGKCARMTMNGDWSVNPDNTYLAPYDDDGTCPDCATLTAGTTLDLPLETYSTPCCTASGIADISCPTGGFEPNDYSFAVKIVQCPEGSGGQNLIYASIAKDGWTTSLGGGGGLAEFQVATGADPGDITDEEFKALLKTLCAGGEIEIPWVETEQTNHCKYSGESITLSLVDSCTGGIAPQEGDCAATPTNDHSGDCDSLNDCETMPDAVVRLGGFGVSGGFRDCEQTGLSGPGGDTYSRQEYWSNLNASFLMEFIPFGTAISATFLTSCDDTSAPNHYVFYIQRAEPENYSDPGILLATELDHTTAPQVKEYVFGAKVVFKCSAGGKVTVDEVALDVQRFTSLDGITWAFSTAFCLDYTDPHDIDDASPPVPVYAADCDTAGGYAASYFHYAPCADDQLFVAIGRLES